MRDLLYGLLICSGNDAAVVLADRVDGNVLQFVEDLNAYLRSIGCSSTHFCNPHGLHHPDHVTTCLDLAKMTKAAMAYPLFQKIVSTKSYVRPKTNLQETKTLVSFNRLLKKGKYFYPFAIGVKTGYHSAAKYTLVAAARKEGRTLIAVLLGSEESKERYLDAKELFEKAFLEKKKKKLLVDKERLFSIKADSDITARVERELCYEYYPSEEEEVSVKAHWEDLSLPIQKGKVIGKMTLETGGVLLESVPLIAEKDVKPSLFYPLKRLLKKMINS